MDFKKKYYKFIDTDPKAIETLLLVAKQMDDPTLTTEERMKLVITAGGFFYMSGVEDAIDIFAGAIRPIL